MHTYTQITSDKAQIYQNSKLEWYQEVFFLVRAAGHIQKKLCIFGLIGTICLVITFPSVDASVTFFLLSTYTRFNSKSRYITRHHQVFRI